MGLSSSCNIRGRILHPLGFSETRAQAVAAHADDRDVFVLQLHGEKQWKVYGEPPVPFPYTHEQAEHSG